MAIRQQDSSESGCGAFRAIVWNFLRIFGGSKRAETDSRKDVDDSTSSETETANTLDEAVRKIVKDFEFTKEELELAVKGFVQQLSECYKL